MRLACLAAPVLGVLFLALPGRAAGQEAPIGHWLTQNRKAVIAIERCGAGLCGRIVGITLDRPTDPIPTDNVGRSQCGLTIIRDAVPDGDEWRTEIVDPRDGSVYRARMYLDEQRRLRVRGYIVIPLLGRTEVWTPFTGQLPQSCRMSPP